MDQDRMQAIHAEMRDPWDQQINVLNSAKPGLMTASEVDEYQRWNLRLRELCKELAKIR